MMKNKGQIHGVAADPRPRDESPSVGMPAVIECLNVLAQGHLDYEAWLAQTVEYGSERLSLAEFDEERNGFLEELYSLADWVVTAWLEARKVGPQ